MELDAPPSLLGTCPIGTNLQLSTIDNKDTVREMKHFPRTPELTQKKSRSLLDGTASTYDPLQSLLRADAMIEAARANEPLTDDEDSDVESDPDYVLYCPSFVGNSESKSFLSPKMSIGSASGINAYRAVYGPAITLKSETASFDTGEVQRDLFTPSPIFDEGNGSTSPPTTLILMGNKDEYL
jgi:hypothetical protein